MKTTFRLSSKKDNSNRQEILLTLMPHRFVDGKKQVITMRAKSGIYIDPIYYDAKCGVNVEKKRRNETTVNYNYHCEQSDKLQRLTRYIQTRLEDADRNNMDSKWLANIVDEFKNPNKQDVAKVRTIYDIAKEYLSRDTLSEGTVKQYKATFRSLFRYEGYIQATKNKCFKIDINTITSKDLDSFREYIRNESEYNASCPQLFKKIISEYPAFMQISETQNKPIQNRIGNNALFHKLNYLKIFWLWLIKQEYTDNNPFLRFEIGSLHYGTPYALTMEEVSKIAYKPMPTKTLDKYRDFFVFQCLVGCRVSDLARFTPDNIVPIGNGEYNIIYTPHKTRREGKQDSTGNAGLTDTHWAIINKYEGKDKHGRLFPNIDKDLYDIALKKVFTIAGITRKVKLHDSITGEEIWKPINEVASSHLARRTYITTLVNNGFDIHAVCSSTGHADGSPAVARYYTYSNQTIRKMSSCVKLEKLQDETASAV